ncbi:MAG: hypothetical protein D6741_00770 [Planctomycetota bacterium]|nr:MAG: hypothetical protein D6741_00770 [Planctomycetota bacterium]
MKYATGPAADDTSIACEMRNGWGSLFIVSGSMRWDEVLLPVTGNVVDLPDARGTPACLVGRYGPR